MLLNSSDLRKKIAEKVAKYKLRPNAKDTPHAIDSMYNKNTIRIKSNYDYRLSTARMHTLYSNHLQTILNLTLYSKVNWCHLR